jgi:SAM-dependent methyltransferase
MSFDALARPYRLLELAAFGGALERARFLHVARLSGCRRILTLGEGDGRFVRRVLEVAPGAEVTCVDSSPAMIGRARRRLAGVPDAGRVRFVCADALGAGLPEGPFDAITTLFFLDCFPAAGVEALAGRLLSRLEPGGLWLFADFAMPGSGWRRARARLWLALLYAFFRALTRIEARTLPPSELILERAGLRTLERAELSQGLLLSSLMRR